MHVKDGVPPKDGAQIDTNEPVSFQEIFYIFLVIVQFRKKNWFLKKFQVEDEAYELGKKLLKLIKADSKNEKTWDNLKGLKLRKDMWYEKVQEEFSCFCCFELILFPVTLPCGHNWCKKCLLKSMAEGKK